MADKLVTVRRSGGDYTTLDAANTGELLANANLVTMNGVLTIQPSGDWSGGHDTTPAVIHGFTVDADHYVKIDADSANRFDGVWDDAKYVLEVSSNNSALSVETGYTVVDGLQVRQSGDNNYAYIFGSGDYITAKNCIFRDGYVTVDAQSPAGRLINCVVYGGNADGIRCETQYRTYIYNCVVAECVNGIRTWGGPATIKNCYSGGNSGSDYLVTDNSMAITTSYSEDGSQSTSTAAFSTSTFTSVTAGSEDFSLVTGSALIGEGTDLSADAVYPFDMDVTGATRSAPWDIGAFLYGSAPAFFFGFIDINGVWKTNSECSIAVNGAWKNVTEIQVAINNAWKTLTS
jgi:hypothetical protein